MKFRTTLVQGQGKNVVGIVVPPEIIEALAGGKRPAVIVTINGYLYRNTVGVMGGRFMVGVAADHRAKAGVNGGDTVDVDLKLDAAPREVAIPEDFAAALVKANALRSFEALAFSHRKEHVRAIEEAKAADTRARRIDKAVQKILAKR